MPLTYGAILRVHKMDPYFSVENKVNEVCTA